MATYALRPIFFLNEQIPEKFFDAGTIFETKKSAILYLYISTFCTQFDGQNITISTSKPIINLNIAIISYITYTMVN